MIANAPSCKRWTYEGIKIEIMREKIEELTEFYKEEVDRLKLVFNELRILRDERGSTVTHTRIMQCKSFIRELSSILNSENTGDVSTVEGKSNVYTDVGGRHDSRYSTEDQTVVEGALEVKTDCEKFYCKATLPIMGRYDRCTNQCSYCKDEELKQS